MSEFRTLIPREAVHRRIRELAVEVHDHYPDVPPCVVSVMEGARVFTRTLLQALSWNVQAHEIHARSYGDQTESSGTVEVTGGLSIPVEGQRVLLVEDIVDTGRTMVRLEQHLLDRGAAEVCFITLLSKPSRRVVDVDLHWVGFEIPNEFVVGFGMDFAGRYRDLDRVAIYEETRAIGG